MILYTNSFITKKCNKTAIISAIKRKLSEIDGEISIDDFELNLILDEAIVNAMEHGNGWDPEKTITVQIYHNDNSIQILIEDEGAGFDYNDIESRKPVWQPASINNIRGRGIFILKQLCDIEWINTGNIIKIILPLKQLL